MQPKVRLGAAWAALVGVACGGEPSLGGEPDGDVTSVDSGGSSAGDPLAASTGEDPTTADSGTERGGGGSSSAGSETASPPVEPGPHFVDVTAEAGLEFDPGELYAPPFCLVDVAGGTGGDYCVPEHFLGAAAVGDYDDDGWPDVYMTRIDGPGLLLRNRGDGTFDDEAAAAGIEPPAVIGGAAWLDLEGDGDLDLMTTTLGAMRNYLYVNDGTGHFEEAALAHGVALVTGEVHVGTGIGVGDYDRDGYVDLFVGDWRPTLVLGPGVDHNRLLHNRGAEAPGHFEDTTADMRIDLQEVSLKQGALPGAYGFAPAIADLDGDQWPDLALAADYGTSRMYWNDGTGQLRDGTFDSGLMNDAHGMGSALGDLDGDGDLDWFVTAIWSLGAPQGNRLFRNDGERRFVDVTDDYGVREGGWGWGAAFFDLEHDGDLDLVMAAGWPSAGFQADPVRLWLNEGAGPWPEVAVARGIDFQRGGRGVVPFDYDGDGDLDLLVHANTEPPALYRNDGASGSWLAVRAEGAGPNTRGLGARVRVQAQPDGPWQVRVVGVGSHLFGQEDAVAHFGLGAGAQPLHRVEVTWPASGEVTVLEQVSRDQVLVVHP